MNFFTDWKSMQYKVETILDKVESFLGETIPF